MFSDFDRHNIIPIINGHGDWYSARLIQLIAKADATNLERLMACYPQEVAIVCEAIGRPVPRIDLGRNVDAIRDYTEREAGKPDGERLNVARERAVAEARGVA